MTKQNIKGDFYMCLIDCNIIEAENKEIKRNCDITYEERCKIEFMIKKKYTMQEMSEELGRNKSIISREINRHCDKKWNYNTGICKKVYSAAVAQGKYEYSRKKAGRKCKLSRALKQFIEDKILIEKWSPEEVAGYIKVNDIKFDIQPSFQLIYYWIEKKKLKIKKRPLFVSECGGYSLAVEGHLFNPKKAYGYGKTKDSHELTETIANMYRKMLIPAIAKGACGCIYTQLSGVEDEINRSHNSLVGVYAGHHGRRDAGGGVVQIADGIVRAE